MACGFTDWVDQGGVLAIMSAFLCELVRKHSAAFDSFRGSTRRWLAEISTHADTLLKQSSYTLLSFMLS